MRFMSPTAARRLARPFIHTCCCLLMTSTASASATSEPAVLVSGRTVPGPGPDGQAALPQLFTWPGSSARVSFEGSSSVTTVLNGSVLPGADAWIVPAARTMIGAEFGSAVFQFELDGEVVGEEGVTPEEPVLVWEMDGLDAGARVHLLLKSCVVRHGTACKAAAAQSSETKQRLLEIQPSPAPSTLLSAQGRTASRSPC